MFIALIAGLSFYGVLGASAAQPSSSTFSAVLTARQEVPKPKGAPAAATGRFTATLKGKQLTWKLSFSRLSGKATAAHIHFGIKGVAGPVVVPLCGSPKCSSPVSGLAFLSPSEISDLKNGKDYVNIHTAKNPGREIRGQVK
jgi:hypothetical protein